MSETLNSNNLNLVGGIVIPAAILGLGVVPGTVSADLLWLALLTVGALIALAAPRGMGRLAGGLLVAGYLAFVVAHIV